MRDDNVHRLLAALLLALPLSLGLLQGEPLGHGARASADEDALPRSWSFEAGLPPDFTVRFRSADGYAGEPAIEARDVRPEVVPVVEERGLPARLGRHVLALRIPAQGRVLLGTPERAFPEQGSDEPAAFSAYLRADTAGPAVLRLYAVPVTGGKSYGATRRKLAERTVAVTTRWARYEVSDGGAAEGAVYGEVEMPAGEAARSLFVDGVQLGAGAATSSMPAVELGVEVNPIEATGVEASDEAHGVLAPGQAATIAVAISRALTADERLSLSIRDVRGRSLDAQRDTALRYRIRPEVPGAYLVRAELRRRGVLRAVAERSFVVVPRPAALPTAGSPFGAHTRLDARHLAIARRLGFRWLRLHDTSRIGNWLVMEPDPGRRQWYDAEVDRARSMGFGLLGVLEATPRWASSAPPQIGWYEARTFPPRDASSWRGYVQATLAHYRGRIDAWEVWNEPYLDEFLHAPPAAYSALLHDAVAAANGTTPTVTLLASAAVDNPQRTAWTRAALLGPSPPFFDGGSRLAIAFHPYDPRLVAPGSVPWAARLHGLVGAGAALWATEGNVLGASVSRLSAPSPFPQPDLERAAAAQVAWFAALLATGAERVFVYQLVEADYYSDSDLSLLEPDGTPRPGAAALAIFANEIGARSYSQTISAKGRHALVFTNKAVHHPYGAPAFDKDLLVVLYRDDLAPLRRLPTTKSALRDVWGAPVLAVERPRLVYFHVASQAELERALESH